MQEQELAAIAGDLNAVTATAERTARHMPLVNETNMLVRTAADALVTLDASPLSFQALKNECEPHA